MIVRFVTVCAAAAVGLALVAAAPAPLVAPTLAELEAKYAQPPSRFVMVDGVRLHVREEGRGPPVVMLNGHLGSLHVYDAWAARLRPHFRVIRLDWPPYGLSIPDPSGVYSTDRAEQLLGLLIDDLKLDTVSLVGTSNGATVAAHYAARHPERVTRLAVSTLPLGVPGPRTNRPESNRQMQLYGKQPVKPRSFYRAVLENIFADPKTVTEPMVTLFADHNNLPGSVPAIDEYVRTNKAMYQTGRLPGLYAAIRAPVLVQWGDGGKVLPADAAQAAVDAFPNAPVTLRRYRAGHMPMLEEPGPTGQDLLAFLQGRLDKPR